MKFVDRRDRHYRITLLGSLIGAGCVAAAGAAGAAGTWVIPAAQAAMAVNKGASPPQIQADLSVSGITPGMTLAQVKAAIPSGYKISVRDHSDGIGNDVIEGLPAQSVLVDAVKRIQSFHSTTNLSDDDNIHVELFNNAVIKVVHSGEFSELPGEMDVNAPTFESYLQAISTKYGIRYKPTYDKSQQVGFIYFDQSGNKLMASGPNESNAVPSQDTACNSVWSKVQVDNYILPVSFVNGFLAAIPNKNQNDAEYDNCYGVGVTVTALVWRANSGLVSRYLVSVTDFRPLQRFAFQALERGHQRNSQEMQDAKSRIPSL